MRKLSLLVGVSHSEISRIENGNRECPNINVIITMCEILGLNPILVLLETNYFTKDMIEDLKKEDNYIKKIGENRYKIKSKTVDELIDVLDCFLSKNVSSESTNEFNNECESCEYYCPYCGECTYEE